MSVAEFWLYVCRLSDLPCCKAPCWWWLSIISISVEVTQTFLPIFEAKMCDWYSQWSNVSLGSWTRWEQKPRSPPSVVALTSFCIQKPWQLRILRLQGARQPKPTSWLQIRECPLRQEASVLALGTDELRGTRRLYYMLPSGLTVSSLSLWLHIQFISFGDRTLKPIVNPGDGEIQDGRMMKTALLWYRGPAILTFRPQASHCIGKNSTAMDVNTQLQKMMW